MPDVWLHEGHDGDPGVVALGLEHLGFSTWANTRSEVLAKLPAKFAWYLAWRHRHGLSITADGSGVEVVGQLTGNEILFPPDLEAATREEVDLTIELLAASRADLVADLESAPEAALDWDPSYRRFAAWADWRTVRAILAHVANGETHYYTCNIGHRSPSPTADASGDWRVFLPRSREEAILFLEGVRGSADLRRVQRIDHGHGEEWWSVRKALRRLVAHELCHWKSIRRILAAYRASQDGARLEA